MMFPKSYYYRHWLVSLTAVSTIFIILLSDTRYSVPAMLKLELAQTQHYFFWVKSEYNYSVSLLEIYLYFDFAFIIAFSSLFCFSLLVIANELNKRTRPLLLLLCCLPGLLDIAENILMLQMLKSGGLSDAMFQLFTLVVAAKWIMVAPFILLSIIVLLYPFVWKKFTRFRA